MPRRDAPPPTYRRRTLRGRVVAIVTLSDSDTGRRRDYVLGEYGTADSRELYGRLLSDWEARGRRLELGGASRAEVGVGLTVAQVLAAYWQFVSGYGYSANHLGVISQTIKRFRASFGGRRAETITARELREWRAGMVRDKLATAGRRTRSVIAIYRWAMLEELVTPSAAKRLAALEPLRNETRRSVGPVPQSAIDAVRPLVSSVVRAMVDVQLLTGMRPGELCQMRPADIDRRGECWIYSPRVHKSQHLHKNRLIYLGPKAQAVIMQLFRGRGAGTYLFDPRDAVAERLRQAEAERVTPAGRGNRVGSNRKVAPRRAPRDHYTPNSYRIAISRACKRAGVDPWHPHQLRHNYATAVRATHGLEAARILLGHSSAVVTEAVYADRDTAAAQKIVNEIG